MDRAELANLTAFVAVADQRSFRAAASQLGVTPSALSHSMRQLEERLGVRLLHRTTRSVSVTDAGLRLLDRLRPAIEQIAGALENLNEERRRPMGRLRIYAMHFGAAAVVAPIWGRFLSTYPEIHLELAVGERPIDIVAKGFDAGIGPQDRAAADMIAVRVMGPLKVAVVGAPSYFAKRRPPRTPDDLVRAQPVDRRANGKIGSVDHHAPVHRNPPRFAVPLKWPNEYVAVSQLPILNTGVTDEIIRRARQAAFRKVTRSPNDGDLQRSHHSDGYHICCGAVLRSDPSVKSLRHDVDWRLAYCELEVDFRVRRQEACPDRRHDGRRRQVGRIDPQSTQWPLALFVQVLERACDLFDCRP